MPDHEFVKDVNEDHRGDQKLWRVGDHYVVTSAVDVVFSGPETYVFAADEDGTITDWMDLPGSFRGGLDHERAITGYVASLDGADVPIPELSVGDLLGRVFGQH